MEDTIDEDTPEKPYKVENECHRTLGCHHGGDLSWDHVQSDAAWRLRVSQAFQQVARFIRIFFAG